MSEIKKYDNPDDFIRCLIRLIKANVDNILEYETSFHTAGFVRKFQIAIIQRNPFLEVSDNIKERKK